MIIDSGLQNWLSLRQTGIARMAATDTLDPIMFHTTLDGVLEWITPRDSGRLLASICLGQLPERCWGNIFNIGGGEPNRLTNLELFSLMLGAAGVQDFREVLDPNWFATRNFHGQWFSDSDLLAELVPYRSQTIKDYVEEEVKNVPWFIRLGGRVPGLVRRRFEAVARGPGGTLSWLAQGAEKQIKAYFGSLQRWQRIPDWEELELAQPLQLPNKLDHGYDESLPVENLRRSDLQAAARFRGGRLLSRNSYQRDRFLPLRWKCHAGHEFSASLNLVLKGGHWCPICTADRDNYPEMARWSPFFSQVWEPEARSL